MSASRLVLWGCALLYAVMWVGGVAAYVLRGGPRPHEAWTAPAFLALAAFLVLWTSRRREAAWLGVVLVLGYLSEYLAVECACVFGPYAYTDALSPRLLGIPVVMSAAWMILIAYVMEMLRTVRMPAWVHVPVAAGWMTAIDLVIDPVAAGPLRYWQWVDTGWYYGIPAWNFAGWFVVSAIMFALLRAVPNWTANRWAGAIGVSVIVFFSVIALSHGLLGAAAAGVALAGLDLLVRAGRAG